MTHHNMTKRVERLEAQSPDAARGRPFLWFQGQSLEAALSAQRLSLEDRPLFAIHVKGVHPGEAEPRADPLYERDRHLLG